MCFLKYFPMAIKNAVFGNVGSMAIYRISTEDANFVEQKFKPTFTTSPPL